MSSMMRVLALVLAVLALAAPASAGTAESPELVDRCGGTAGDDGRYVWVIHESMDLCAGWFETLSERDATPEIAVTLRTAGPLADRPPSFIAADWASGDCTYTAFVDDSTSAEIAQGLQVGCGERPDPTCTVGDPLYLDCRAEGYYRYFELPAGAIVENGNELRFTIRFDGQLAEFAGDHAHDSLLVGTGAFTSLVAGPVYAWTFGCTFGLGQFDRCDEVNGDAIWSGADYTVGS